ncbi:hypothetical protein CALVIDRAFT_332550 [Calocera viscosa TUFC12733]|uniref:Uncharacterized protein n=1 Tax=Calocera viscosa (strain TUFC12733) TaxID=1330018 RepID=A0A167HPK3_CALVF|nr:hypothetical protein CALVIDRAFT_332550 [Calocera viscosa TUFC12733]
MRDLGQGKEGLPPGGMADMGQLGGRILSPTPSSHMDHLVALFRCAPLYVPPRHHHWPKTSCRAPGTDRPDPVPSRLRLFRPLYGVGSLS